MASSGDKLKQAARRAAGLVVKEAVQRLAAEVRTPPPLPHGTPPAESPSAPTPPPVVPPAPTPAPAPTRSAGRPSAEAPDRMTAGTDEPHEHDPGVVFRSSIAYAGEAPAEALVIACNSYLYLPQTIDFLHRGLGLHAYDLIAVPGGMQWLALPDLLPKHHRVTRWAVEYLVRKHQVKRVIGIAHQGCSAYEDESTLGSLARLATGKSTDEHQCEHLLRVGRGLQADFGVAVELYYASLEEGGTVAFRRLESGGG
jgi:hypothetical protein